MPIPVSSGAEARRLRKAPKKKASPTPASRSDAAQRTGARTPTPKATPKPTRRQVVQAKRQERQYASQGKAVEKQATRKTRIRKRREARVRGRSDAAQGNQTRAAEAYKRTPEYKKIQQEAFLKHGFERAKKNTQLGNAPVMKVLEQTTRPVHASAAATRAAIKGENIPKAAVKGAKLEDKSLYSDVLKDLGAPQIVQSVGGFGLDVVADPTTYVTFGAGSVAKKAATSAARKAEKKATKAGLSTTQAKAAGERAAKQTLRKSSTAKGVTVKVAGKELPGVRKTTAKAAQPVGKVVRKATPAKARTGSRNVAADVNPNVAPTGVSKEAHQEAVRATRTARAKASQGRDRAQKRGLALKRRVSKKDYSRITDALEQEAVSAKAGRKAIAALPEGLRDTAVRVRADLRQANKQRKRAGVKGGERKGYVPRALTEEALEAEGKKLRGSGVKTIRPGYSKARTEKRPMREIRKEQPGRYSENLPSLVANRVAKGSEDAARADLNRRLGEMGREVKRGRQIDLKAGEAVFHIRGSDIRKVDDAEIAKATASLKPVVKNDKVVRLKGASTQGGRYVVLSEDVVQRATEGVAPKLDFTDKGLVRGYDKAQAGFKRIALATPGYHVRNLIGDSFNAFLAQSGRRLPGNMAKSARVLKAAGRQERANLKMLPVVPKKGAMKTGRYGKLTYDEIAAGLAKAGAFRTGFTAKEIPELAGSGKTGVPLKWRAKGRMAHGVKRAFLNREDLPRVATAVEALRKGATWEEAAAYVAEHHFDYQLLTQFERNVARRLAPFYTFTARNIPLQAKKVITNPGKYAQYEKLRQEAAKATGMDEDVREARAMYEKLEKAGVELPEGWEKYLTDWEKRNAGVPISWKGNKFTISFALPLGDLSELPGAAGKDQFQEYFQKAMSLATPVIKNPVEYFSNYSFFFRDQLQREWSPNVAAPDYVALFPDDLKAKVGVTKIKDKRTGEMVWGWPAKTDYIAKSVPGAPAFIQNMMTGGDDRRNRKDTERILGFLGAKAVPIDAVTNAVNLSYARMDEIAERKGSLNQQGINAENPNVEYQKLLKQEKLLREITFTGKRMRGDAVLPKTGGPAKPRVRHATPKTSTGGGGFDLDDYSGSSGSSSGGSTGGGGFSISSY